MFKLDGFCNRLIYFNHFDVILKTIPVYVNDASRDTSMKKKTVQGLHKISKMLDKQKRKINIKILL